MWILPGTLSRAWPHRDVHDVPLVERAYRFLNSGGVKQLSQVIRRYFSAGDGTLTTRETYLAPEAKARRRIDEMLTAAGWVVQDYRQIALGAAQGVAVREFPMASGHGRADYLLFIDRKAAGVIEAKKAGSTLTGVEWQAAKYTLGLPTEMDAWGTPLPFAYESTGVETTFTNALDPEPASRRVFSFHQPVGFRGGRWRTRTSDRSLVRRVLYL
jgi:type I site-specific restriction endonuclease